MPGYDPSLYQCHRSEALSRDGVTRIPISLVYKAPLSVSGEKRPLLLDGDKQQGFNQFIVTYCVACRLRQLWDVRGSVIRLQARPFVGQRDSGCHSAYSGRRGRSPGAGHMVLAAFKFPFLWTDGLSSTGTRSRASTCRR